jgi:hypothetical protein
MWPAAHRLQICSGWSKLNPGQQACWVLVHLRNGHTFAALAAGFGVGTTTAWSMSRTPWLCWPPRPRHPLGVWVFAGLGLIVDVK